MSRWMPKIKKRVKLMILEYPSRSSYDSTFSANVILFENRGWRKFEVPGGRLGKDEHEFEAALIREIKEETFNSIDVSKILGSDKIRFIDFQNDREIVRVYFIIISPGLFDGGVYNENKSKLIRQPGLPKDWKEMSGYDKFPIDRMINDVDDGNTSENFYCTNSRGQKRPIYPKTQKYLSEAVRRGVIKELLDNECIFNASMRQVDMSNTFLNGTSTIVVM
jgi:hypothetical protein